MTLREPKYTKKAITSLPSKNGFDKFSIILSPSATEKVWLILIILLLILKIKAMKKMEEENTMVFLVDIRANKN